MIGIDEPQPVGGFALFHLGFRPFFLAAALFAVAAMMVWMGIYIFGWEARPYGVLPVTWHAHEMIFGYGIAVIAGFLLTAVRNWTGIQTPDGIPLMLLFLLWLSGRVLPFFTEQVTIELVAVVDNLFLAILFLAIVLPVIRTRQWKNVGVVSKVLLMLASNVVFYLGVVGILENGIYWGLYSGLYLVLALVFTMGRRVIPFFIERGVDETVQLKNRKWLDISSLILFILFWAADVLLRNQNLAAGLAAILFVLHSIRLAGWTTPGIWRKPLLWSLYLAYGFLIVGFLLKAAVPIFHISPYLPLHAFAFGGVGMMTLGMMSRVALGHTGRNIQEPPVQLSWIFAILFTGAVVRVILPLIDSVHSTIWIGASQVLWIISFAVFVFVYLPILVRPRIDGRYG